MHLEDFIILVFCTIDDQLKKILKGKKLRQRGFAPKLSDSEVITMEIVGEFLGKDCDKKIWEYFKIHWNHFFPNIPDRSNFARQAANLHQIKYLLQKNISKKLGALTDQLHSIDGFPIPVCKFARANFCKNFKGEAAYGYCATKKERYYGFKGHLSINSIGVISSAEFAASNIDERDLCFELLKKVKGLVLGDKGYIRPSMQKDLEKEGIYLQTPLRDNMKETRPQKFLIWLKNTRRLIETVIGQLTEMFHIEKVRAKDLWHQFSRFWRKILAHTICIKINKDLGNSPLQFEKIITC